MGIDVEATKQLLSHRKALFAYIHAIVRDHHFAEDVFQDVSVTILQKWDREEEIRDFWRFAREVAKRQALAALRKKARRSALLSEKSLAIVDRGFDEVSQQAEERQEALGKCLGSLPELWQKIVRLKYWEGLSVARIAESLKRTENTISVTLNRLRSRLADCVSRNLHLGQTA